MQSLSDITGGNQIACSFLWSHESLYTSFFRYALGLPKVSKRTLMLQIECYYNFLNCFILIRLLIIFVNQCTTIMTSAAETGEWSMLFQRQTLLTLFVLFMLWITHRTLLSIPHPRPHSPFRVGHGLHFCHSCSQARELICDSSRPALYLYDW